MIENMVIRLLQRLRLYGVARSAKDRFTFLNPIYYRHRHEMLDFYGRFINKGDLCFDVGANMGNRTEIFLKLGATVVAVEPQDVCIKQLRKKYGNNKGVILIQKALGEKEGESEMTLSNAHTISSMRKEWIDTVKASGRFSVYEWNRIRRVQVTTLDKLIKRYGRPVFCKIDVEGYEDKVLEGLSQTIEKISFEFTSEFIEPALNSIAHLSKLGTVEFNYSLQETMRFTLVRWIGAEEMRKILFSIQDKRVFGDIYARFMELRS